MKQRLLVLALLALGAAAIAIGMPRASQAAAAQVILRGVTLVGSVDTTNHSLTVRSTEGAVTSDFIVTYTLTIPATATTKAIPGTRIGGNPRGLTLFTDWRQGDPLTVTGKIIGYDAGKLKIAASGIDYQLRGVAIKNYVGIVENKNTTTNQISVSIKPGAFFTTTQVSNVGQSGGPTLTGAADVNAIPLASNVRLQQVWRPDPTTGVQSKFKDLSVTVLTPLPANAVGWVVRAVGAGTPTTYSLGAGFNMPLTVSAGNKILLQNENSVPLYVRIPDSERAKFATFINAPYITVKAKSIATLVTKAPVSTSILGQPIATLPSAKTLIVTKTGNGLVKAGTGINCGTVCSATYADSTNVILTATPTTGYLISWGGACTGTASTCTLTMGENKSVTANFVTSLNPLTLSIAQTGTGTVTFSPVGTSCVGTTSCKYTPGTVVTLTGTPGPTLNTWWVSGCTVDPDLPDKCTVVLNADTSVNVQFTRYIPL